MVFSVKMHSTEFFSMYPYIILLGIALTANLGTFCSFQALTRQREAEVRELQRSHESQLKSLKERLNKEYHDLEEKLRYVFSL